jgi:hypothetical protein
MSITPINKQLRTDTNRANAQKSTGPASVAGKQRSSMNAVKHNLSGQNLILQAAEMDAYNRLAAAMHSDLQPRTESERQIVQKIVDTHFRLNRLAAIENNLVNFALLDNETDTPHDDRIEAMVAQTRAWIERSGSFDVLGRYEGRLTRQLLQLQLEFERLQKNRPEPDETEGDRPLLASFGRSAPALVRSANSDRILTHLTPPEPQATAEPDRSQPSDLGPTG